MRCDFWCALGDEELARHDIAEVNLSAAFDLPEAGRLDIRGFRRKLDRWADLVKQGTDNVRDKYNKGEYRGLSQARFKMMALVTVIQRNLGVKYNLSFNEGEYDAGDSRNLFLHGILTGHGGTCTTMPVLYAAIGRRLGYPIKLVEAKDHFFCRWDDPDGERFTSKPRHPVFVTLPTNTT